MIARVCLIALLAAAVLAQEAADEVVLQHGGHHKKTTTRRTTTRRTTTTTTTASTTTTAQFNPLPDTTDPSSFCLANYAARNQKDLYPDRTDCHRYIQCFFIDETSAIGFRRNCPAGQFWHDVVLSCLPEGATPCVDRCLDSAVAAKGSYAGSGCKQYFACSNTGSNGMCCPDGTRWNDAESICEESATCLDACIQAGPAVPTTVAPAQAYNSTVCRDSFGTYIASVAGVANAYILIDEEGQATETRFCPSGVSFDLSACRCDIESDATQPTPAQRRQATFWATFDADTEDQSVNKFATFLVDNAQRDSSVSAVGGGSLAVNGGYLQIPGLKSFDSRNSASWAFFFRGQGGILSNSRSPVSNDFTYIFGATASSLSGRLSFWAPVGVQAVSGSYSTPASGWNHAAITYDSSAVRVYINGALVDTQFVGGFLSISAGPLNFGWDSGLGFFNGYLDDLLITPFALTTEEINAHRTGDRAYLAAQGFW